MRSNVLTLYVFTIFLQIFILLFPKVVEKFCVGYKFDHDFRENRFLYSLLQRWNVGKILEKHGVLAVGL